MTWLLTNWKLLLGGVAAVLLAITLAHCDGYRDGKRDTDARWQQKIAEDAAAQRARELKAGEDMLNRERMDRLKAEQTQRENDDAVRNIPDQATSPRQHASACVRLRRERPSDSGVVAACGAASAPR